MTSAQDEQEELNRIKERTNQPEGGVDIATGGTTGALAGAVIGASGGPLGLVAGAIIGGALGSIASYGREHPYYPEPWLERREQLHGHHEHTGYDNNGERPDQHGTE